MKKPKKITISFNPDHDGVYLLVGIDDDFHKIYISEQQHGNILKSCVDSYFEKKSIALLNDAIQIEKDSEKLLEKTERMLNVMKHI